MPFDPRTKSRNTTTLPAALRDELGLAAPSARKRHDRAQRFNPHTGSSRPQLRAIGRPQSALNGAQKGTSRGPIKSLRNQEKEHKEQLRQQRSHPGSVPSQHKQHRVEVTNNASSHASSSRMSEANDVKSQQKRKSDKQPEEALKVIKKPKGTSSKAALDQAEPIEPKTRLNPFTGEVELVKSSRKKSSSEKPTALEKMLARAEAGPSSSSRSRSTDALAGGKKKSRRNMTQQEKEEEDEIRWLEYSLGNSRKGQDVVRDDLDDFLDDLDKFQVGMYDESDSEDEDEEDSDDSGLEEVTASEEDEKESEESEEGRSESEAESEDAEGDSDLEGMVGTYEFDSNDEDDFSNWDAAMATTDEEEQQDDDDDDDDDDEEELSESDDDSEAEEARALIDGAASTSSTSAAAVSTAASSTASTTATATSKYIPPALRAKLAAESSSVPSSTPITAPAATDLEMDPIASQKLRRQAQGLLNRLGDANIETILTDYEALYRTHPRAHVTSTITQLVLDTITSRSNLVDTFVILHAALVAALHKVVGVEFAAFFVQRLVEELTRHYTALKEGGVGMEGEEEGEEKGKECLNLTVLACELYNLHVVACPLIYDLIRMFLGEQLTATRDKAGVSEVDIELLLKTIRSCGFQLRSDDPTSLKSIIALTQSRVASSSSTGTSTRTKFMLERMTDLDKKSTSGGKAGSNDASNANSAAGQLLTRMKKFLGGLGRKRTVKAHEALRIGLKDLQDADRKGKWWLVGAAWTGQSDQTDAQGLTKLLPMNATASSLQSSSSAQTPAEDPQHTELLSLARAQGMNTDTRRLVFITLLTSADFRQAAENLLLLKLNDTQRREIIRVLIHCLGSESTYNPYYTLIGQEICRNHHGMRITLQYCLWDFLREIGQKQVGGEKFSAALFESVDQSGDGVSKVDPRRIGNMARAYAWWISKECLSLQSLKTIDFTALHPIPAQFLGLLLIHLVLSIQSKSAAKTLHLPTVTAALKHERLTKLVQANLIGGSSDLSKGLLLFLNTKLDGRSQRKLVLGEEKGLREKMRSLLEVVKEGVEVVRRTVQVIVQQQDGVADGGEDGEDGVGMDSEDDGGEDSDEY